MRTKDAEQTGREAKEPGTQPKTAYADKKPRPNQPTETNNHKPRPKTDPPTQTALTE
jgi:hypothetical protein